VHDQGHDHDGRLHDLPELRRLEVRLSSPAAAIAGLVLALAAACFARAADEALPVPDAPASATETTVPDTPPPPRRARNVDLDAPVMERPGETYTKQFRRDVETRSDQAQDEAMRSIDDVDVAHLPQSPVAPFVMLEAEVAPGTSARLAWQPAESFEGIEVATPVLVVNGAAEGPVLCLTAAVHGDELNGIEMVRRVLYDIDPQQLHGTVVGVPIVNLIGFKRASRYLSDRRDLNRHFPGNPRGSSASRIAHSFFNQVISHCTILVDLHTGSFYRSNLPQIRGDLRRPEVVRVAEAFTSTAIIHSPGASGSLRRAAVERGIPAVTLEAGEPMRLQVDEVEHGVRGIFALIDQLGMYRKLRVWGNPVAVHYQSRWVRSETGGILFGKAELGQQVAAGDLLGSVTDPITNMRADIVSPYDGRVIGKAVDQVVLPGFAAFHIGIETSAEDLYEPRALVPAKGEEDDEERPDVDPESRDSLEDS
jgi:predicted deacylase